MISTSLSRRGYTLLEILIAVTLMMIIMLGITQLFSSVGTQINNTQATLQLVGSLRSVKTRLEADLGLVTADLTKAPPMKTGLNQGYFSIIEGMGAAHTNALLRTRDYTSPSQSVTGADIAFTSDSSDLTYDNTVGDMDDILMFTAYAPAGQPFRGLAGGQVRASNTAEIIWFCRGNTLYRRTLLILPDLEFQNILNNSSGTTPAMKRGLGFYQYNDVSVRIDPNTGLIAANSLEDLEQRQNRFGHTVSVAWNNDGTFNKTNTDLRIRQAFPFNPHKNSAIYYMRMPTMLETSHLNWDVSQSFAWNLANCTRLTPPLPENPELKYKNFYPAGSQTIPYPSGESSVMLPGNSNPKPFIDFWEHPFPWSELAVVGNTDPICMIDPITGTPQGLTGDRYAEDVILTNVISFDVQVWDEIAGRYVNLGEAQQSFDSSRNDVVYHYTDGTSPGPIGLQGQYSLHYYDYSQDPPVKRPNSIPLPCVYDTWSEEYEREGYEWPNRSGTLISTAGRDLQDNDGNGTIDDIDEWTTPPPYSVPLRGVKITIRTFDPLSKNIRDMTVIHHFK